MNTENLSTEGLSPQQQSVLAAIGGIIPNQQEALVSELTKVTKPVQQQTTPQPTKQEPKPLLDAQEEKVQKKEEPKQERAEDDTYVDSPLFGGKKNLNKKQQQKEARPLPESYEQLAEIYKKEFGINAEDPKEAIAKGIDSTKKWRTDAQKAEDYYNELGNYKKFFESMPEDMLQSLTLLSQGGDYTTPFTNKPKIDIAKDFSQLDTKQVVEHYFPGQFTPDDFAEIDNKALKIATQSAKERFNIDKSNYERERASVFEQAQKKNDLVKKSIGSSVENLRKAFPDLTDSAIQSIQRKLEGGDIKDVIYNKDGSYTEKAALVMAMSEYGLDLIGQLTKAAENKGKTAGVETILDRGADVPSHKKKGSSVNQDSKALEKKIEDLIGGLIPKRTF